MRVTTKALWEISEEEFNESARAKEEGLPIATALFSIAGIIAMLGAAVLERNDPEELGKDPP